MAKEVAKERGSESASSARGHPFRPSEGRWAPGSVWGRRRTGRGNRPVPRHLFSSLRSWPPFCAAACLRGHRALSEGDGGGAEGEQEQEKGGWPERGSARRALEPVCGSVCPDPENPNLLQPFCGPGGSSTLAGTERPPRCCRSRKCRSSFLLKLRGWWLNLNGLQHSQGACEVTGWFHKNWVRALVLGKKSTVLR